MKPAIKSMSVDVKNLKTGQFAEILSGEYGQESKDSPVGSVVYVLPEGYHCRYLIPGKFYKRKSVPNMFQCYLHPENATVRILNANETVFIGEPEVVLFTGGRE